MISYEINKYFHDVMHRGIRSSNSYPMEFEITFPYNAKIKIIHLSVMEQIFIIENYSSAHRLKDSKFYFMKI